MNGSEDRVINPRPQTRKATFIGILLAEKSNSCSVILNLFWRPRQGLIYRPWSKGDEHTGKSAEVKIRMDGRTYNGHFHGERKNLYSSSLDYPQTTRSLELPSGRVKIKKRETTTVGEQPILYWKTITYEVFVNMSD